MVKYIASGILALLLLFIGLHFSKTKLKLEKDVQVIIVATIQQNDELQLFYKSESEDQFSEEQSIKQKVNGKSTPQTVAFDLPNDINFTQFRLDLGNNPEQKPILLDAYGIKINAEVEGFLNIQNDIAPNEFLSQNNKSFVPRMVDGKYDPFVVTNDNLIHILNILEAKQEKTYSPLGIILSIVFSLAFFLFLLNLNYSITPKQTSQLPYIVCFVAIIALPGIANLFGFELNRENLEKRKLAEKPKLSLSKDFPSRFEAYYNDHFGFRNLLVEQSAKFKLKVFNSFPKLDKVQGGEDNFLFYNDITEHIYPSYSHQDTFTQEQLEKKLDRLLNQKAFLDNRGIDFILTILPNKATIYPEKLARNMQSQIPNTPSLADQYEVYFVDKEIEIYNVTKDLLAKKTKYQLYQKLDSHWNSLGAYFAYQSILNHYQNILQTKPLELNAFDIKFEQISEGDLSKMVGLKDIDRFQDLDPVFTLKDTENTYTTEVSEGHKVTHTFNPNTSSDKKLLIFRDSFTTKLIPFFSSTFRDVTYVSGDFDEKRIEEVKPDVVMVLKVERLIKFF